MEEKVYSDVIDKTLTTTVKESDNVLKTTKSIIETSRDEIIKTIKAKDETIKNLINDNYLLIQNAYVQRTKYMEMYENNYKKTTKLIYILIVLVVILSITIGVLVVELY